VSPLELDHVLIAVDDLDARVAEFERATGLASIDGGRHRAWGTANRIVPLGDTYLELIAVVDSGLAATTTLGRWVARTPNMQPMGWVARTDDIDAVARRLGLAPVAGSRMTPDGRTLTWRTAGTEQASDGPALPFFIEWGRGVRHPGRASAPGAPPSSTARIVRVVVSGDEAALDAWLGGVELPVEVRPGPSALRAVVVERADREIVIGERYR
jgi:hypothetical protein